MMSWGVKEQKMDDESYQIWDKPSLKEGLRVSQNNIISSERLERPIMKDQSSQPISAQ